MRILSALRTSILALAVLSFAVVTAQAGTGAISIRIVKAGFFVGGSAGSGTFTYQKHSYPLSIGGISAGLVFGGAKITFSGTADKVYSVSDIEGVYAAAGAGAAATGGNGVIVLTNPKGVVLSLSGRQKGLMVNLDLSGMAISLK